MNTIKIYLDASGAVASLQKDFPLYQFQYNNKLVNIFVPTSICAGPFIDDNITTGYVCTMSMKATDWNGVSKQTGAYALRYLKTLTHNGIEYALFERALPYAFTIYAGQDQAAPKMTISVLNVADGGFLSIINSQTVSLDIMESNDAFDVDYSTLEPTAATWLQAQIDTLTADLALKLNADTTNDNNKVNPNGDNHIVVDNINALINATSDLPNMRDQIDQNTADIADLKTLSIYGWNVVGTHEIVSQSAQDDNAIPSDADLISWIEALKGSTIEKGDAIFIYWDNYASADDVSLFWYAGTAQNGSYFRQVPYMIHMAGNSVAGLIEGTYRADLTGQADKLMVDIVNGQVINVYKVKHDESGVVSLKDVIDQAYAKLIANTAAVEMAVKDANGNIITATYLTKAEGASKKYVQDYASPKALYDLNYPDYATDEFKNVNVNDNSYNKTTNSTSIGYTILSNITKNLEADILLGDQNGVVNRIWINSNNTESIKLRITTAYTDSNNVMQTLSIQETETFLVVTGVPVLKQIESVFSGLTTPITLPSGTAITQTIEVWRENSTSADFTLLCNETYNAYMTFNKIGYVRYALEQEPSAIECGHDSIPTIDSDGDLQVASDGQIHYANGSSAPLTTILKIPMDNGLSDPTSVLPARAGQVLGALKKMSNPNILVNSNFAINSKGQTTYTGLVDMMDAWKGNTASTSVTINNDGTISVSGANFQFTYWFEDSDWKQLIGKTLTLSASSNGVVYSAVQSAIIDGNYSGTSIIFANGCIARLRKTGVGAKLFVQIIGTANNDTLNLDWVKLEIGSIATAYTPPTIEDYWAKKLDNVIDMTNWTSPLTSAQLDLIAQAEAPILKYGSMVFYSKDLSHPSTYKFISQGSGDSVNRYTLMEIDKTVGTISLSYDNVPNETALAPLFSTLATYSVGDVVTYGGDLYQCATAVTTAGDFDPAQWTSISVKTYVDSKSVKAEVDTFDQLVKPFSDSDWTFSTYTSNQGIIGDTAYFTPTAQNGRVYTHITVKPNHIYYFGGEVKLDNASTSAQINLYYAEHSISLTGSTNWQRASIVSKVVGINSDQTIEFRVGCDNTTFSKISTRNLICVDLTATYGAGAEPSLAECQKIFGGTYPYGTNKISVLEDSQKITAYQTPIQTKAVSFNQIIKNPNYNGTTDWTISNATATANNGELTFTATAQYGYATQQITTTSGHKYYVSSNLKATSQYVGMFVRESGSDILVKYHSGNGNYEQLNGIFTASSTSVYLRTIIDVRTSGWNVAYSKNVMIIDLTAMGLDNLTLSQCQALFNAPSYAYTSGTDMQLLSDYNGALALVELPAQVKLYMHDCTIFNSGSPQTTMLSLNLITRDSAAYNLASLISAIRAQGSGTQRIQCSGCIYYNGGVYVSSYMVVTSSQAGWVAQSLSTGESYTFYTTDITLVSNDVVRPLY